jgi:hypothetical protein
VSATTSIVRNGVFPPGSLQSIPGGFLAKGEVAESWLAMFAAARRDGITLKPAGPDSSARSFDRQVFWRNFWCSRGQCFRAAIPGTSNHGWARAVDVWDANQISDRNWQWLNENARQYGWSNAEGAGVGEPWHWVYVGGFVPRPDPLEPLPPHVRHAAQKLLFHRRGAIAEAVTGKGPKYQAHIKWRAWWFERVEAMQKRARRERTRRILARVLKDRDGVLT